MEAPAAPRIVLCPSKVYLTPRIGHSRMRPTTEPPPLAIAVEDRLRSRSARTTTGWLGARQPHLLRLATERRERITHSLDRCLVAEADGDRLGVPVPHRDPATGRANHEIRRPVLAVPGAEELARLLGHLLLFSADEGNDVIDHVERRHARVAGAGDGLHGRDHDRIEPEGVL